MRNKNQKLEPRNRIVISLGDPTGIGIEVTLKALGSKDLPQNMHPLLIGCKRTVELVYIHLKKKGVSSILDPSRIEIEDHPFSENCILGHPNSQSGEASFKWLTRASNILIEQKARALVTAPIAKHLWQEAGHFYPGQTERLAEITNSSNTAMLFTAISPNNGWRFNTLLATTHIPLNKVSETLTPKLINLKLNSLLKFCQRFKKRPKLFVAGLNPHAGENGKLGNEEIEWLSAAIKEWKKNNPEITISGPISPDVCWISAAKAWVNMPDGNSPDGILAMYHDQGLIPVKTIAFDSAVNTTLGLPFIRTSPDHGTGFDIAGKGTANHESMLAAIKAAWELSSN